MTALIQAVRFFRAASRGYRLCPWRSPYLRWRLETFTGIPAPAITLSDFLRIAWSERRQLLAFFRWTGELRDFAGETIA